MNEVVRLCRENFENFCTNRRIVENSNNQAQSHNVLIFIGLLKTRVCACLFILEYVCFPVRLLFFCEFDQKRVQELQEML